MSYSTPRQSAISEVNSRTPRKFEAMHDKNGNLLRVSEYFGINTFDLRQMREKLPKNTYEKLVLTIERGKKLDTEIAATVAHAVKEWALERGVTHFCHWFQPQTGSTAEKHDAFLTFEEGKKAIERFSGSQLIQSEPDASSFPSGGMRTTFEARGYTAWDPSSPIFIMEATNGKTLCIPSAFISYHGDALDEKTGLLRSMDVLSQKATALLDLIGDKGVKRVVPTLGVEQEYFLVDRAFYSLRPDLVMTGRSLLGAAPPKGQQLEDHYFGSIPPRVQAFMSEMEQELYKLGVPVKTRHNEVAPNQYETAPIFEEVNIATDHNQVVMETIRRVARRHQFEGILHEKPFAGINGSGKHCNWALSIAASGADLDGTNLLEPGKTPHQNLRFLLFLCAVLKGVHKHGGLLRAGIASAGNDYRLGANEAPPAIISVFLGDMLTRILNDIEKGSPAKQRSADALIGLGVSKIPEIMKDNTDRNRTSPFAFTGNKFEFRAVGSSANPGFPVMLVNAAVADGIDELTARLQKKLGGGSDKVEAAIFELLREVIQETKAIRFEGNNYSDEWVKEAAERGLPNLRKTPEALAQLTTPSSRALLTGFGIFSESEVTSRYKIRLEIYIKRVLIEVEMLKNMLDTLVLPAAFTYHGELAQSVAQAKAAGVMAPQAELLGKLTGLITLLQQKMGTFNTLAHKVESLDTEELKAQLLSKELNPLMQDLRVISDDLENMIADHHWPLPKYREMLFLA